MQLVINPETKFLELRHNLGNALFVDFNDKELQYKRANSINNKALIAKAIGCANNKRPFVVDATAGLGKDAFFIACLECRVLLVERNEILGKLLQDGLLRATEFENLAKITNNMSLVSGNALDVIPNLSEIPDVIYLDPMFPERTKSALVKKQMRVLRELVGDDTDAARLLDIALKHCKSRVVVKRPRYAPTLNSLKPNVEILGSRSRYDVYFV